MSAAEHDRFADDAGAYLLGALEEQERTAFERHLATCHVCRDEVERLRLAADALPRSVEQFAAPPTLKASLMEQVRAEARPRPRRAFAGRFRLRAVRPRLVAVAAACALLAGAAAGIAISQLDGDGARTIAADVDGTRLGMGEATLVLPEDGGPGALELTGMPQPPRGHVYAVWLRRDGRIEPGPLFTVDRNGRGVAAVPEERDGVDAVMVTRERAGGTAQPTEAPVIVAEL